MFLPRIISHNSYWQPFARSTSQSLQRPSLSFRRNLQTTVIRRDRSFTNFLADDNPPPVQVSSLSDNGILLVDGLLIPGACIFLEGKVYLWDVPEFRVNDNKQITEGIWSPWNSWSEERFQIFDVVAPRPGG